MRVTVLMLFLALVAGCAAAVDETFDPATACGPRVSANSVRVIDVRDAYRSGGANGAILYAESRVGPVDVLSYELAGVYFFGSVDENASSRGCVVVLLVGKSTDQMNNSRYASKDPSHFVLLGRRVEN